MVSIPIWQIEYLTASMLYCRIQSDGDSVLVEIKLTGKLHHVVILVNGRRKHRLGSAKLFLPAEM